MFRHPPHKTPQPIDIKFCKFDYVSEIIKWAKRLELVGHGRLPRQMKYIMSCHYSIYILSHIALPELFFVQCSTDQTARPILAHDGSDDQISFVLVPGGNARQFSKLLRNASIGSTFAFPNTTRMLFSQ